MSFAVGADAYDRFMGRYSAPLAPAFAEFAAVIDGQHVLDVGCGPGALTAELVKRLGPTAVGAVDPSDTFVAAAHARYPAVDVRRATNEGGDAENVAENPMRWWDLADVWCIWDVGLRSSVSRR